MSAFVEYVPYGNNPNHMPVEGQPFQSETIASAAKSTYKVPSNMYVSITTDENGYVAIGSAPDASQNPRHRMISGVKRTFMINKNDSIAYLLG